MGNNILSRAAAFMFVLLAVCGCQTTADHSTAERFTEAPFVDVVLVGPVVQPAMPATRSTPSMSIARMAAADPDNLLGVVVAGGGRLD